MPQAAVDVGALLQRLMRAATMVEARLEAAIAPTGLSLARLGVLHKLMVATEPLAVGQLAERIVCVRSNVTQLVGRLEAEGLVRREADLEDRRVVRAAITAEGRRRYAEAMRARARLEAELAGALPAGLGPVLTDLLAGLTLASPRG